MQAVQAGGLLKEGEEEGEEEEDWGRARGDMFWPGAVSLEKENTNRSK